MKNKKFSLIALALALVICLTSCGYLFGSVAEQGDVTVVVETADGYEVYKTYLESIENKDEGATGILEQLNQRKDKLHLEMDDTGYGAFVTAVGSIKQDTSTGSYVMVYTSVATDSYEGAPTVEYEGITLYQSGVGISGMTVESGTVILFRLETFSY